MMPDNAGYYAAAYVAAAVIYSLYGLSLVVRTRALRARAAALAPREDPR
jgi:hypothetical protein